MPKVTRQRKAHTPRTARITLTVPLDLLEMIDKAAEKDFTTRSEIMRTAALWYLRPQGRDLNQTDPDTILKVLQHRKFKAMFNKTREDIDAVNQ